MSTVSKSAALWHQPEARFWPRMKDWVNFHITSPHYYPIQSSVAFGAKRKLKALLKKSAVAIPAVVGLRQSLKRTIPSSRFFRAFVFFFMEFLLLWCNRKCGWFSWYFGSTSKVSGECFLFIYFWYLSFIGLLLAQILKGWWVASRAVGCRVPTIFWVAGGGAGEGGNELIGGGRKCDLEMNLCFPRRLTAIRLVGLVRLFEYFLDWFYILVRC